jgi:putative tryptophan/tyrosine transport system substrate-binding protein
MQRREFIAFASAAAAGWPLVVRGKGAVARIGFFSFLSAELPLEHALPQGLLEAGWVEGQNILFERRYAAGDVGRLDQFAAEMVQNKVALIIGFASSCTLAAKKATASIPIVMVGTGDPVGQGFVESLTHPGGNITGLSFDVGPEITAKQVQLLKEAVPEATRLAVLWNPNSPFLHPYLEAIRVQSKRLGVSTQSLQVQDPNDIKGAFAAMKQAQADVLIVLSDSFATLHRGLIADLAAQQRLPAIYGWRAYIDAGALMSYGPSLSDLFHGAARYVDKILRGAKPSDLPVEQPTKFELIINLKVAKTLGLSFPQTLLTAADEVIE